MDKKGLKVTYIFWLRYELITNYHADLLSKQSIIIGILRYKYGFFIF